jgi:HEPN domain-containing protein
MKETVECWLTFAREDLRTAEILLENRIYNQSCFHTQQCIEKALKALLIHHRGHMPPKTHVISDLLGLLPSEWFTDLEADVSRTMESY